MTLWQVVLPCVSVVFILRQMGQFQLQKEAVLPRSRLNLGQGLCCRQAGLLSRQKELIKTSLSCKLRMPVRTGEYGQLVQGQVTANRGKPLSLLFPCTTTPIHRLVACRQFPVSRISCLENLGGGSSPTVSSAVASLKYVLMNFISAFSLG